MTEQEEYTVWKVVRVRGIYSDTPEMVSAVAGRSHQPQLTKKLSLIYEIYRTTTALNGSVGILCFDDPQGAMAFVRDLCDYGDFPVTYAILKCTTTDNPRSVKRLLRSKTKDQVEAWTDPARRRMLLDLYNRCVLPNLENPTFPAPSGSVAVDHLTPTSIIYDTGGGEYGKRIMHNAGLIESEKERRP